MNGRTTKTQRYKARMLAILEKMGKCTFLNTGIATNAGEEKLLHVVLLATVNGERVISTEIADRIGLTRSAVSQIVTKLESRGIVKRVAAEDDKKIAYIEFTEQSKERIAAQDSQCSNFFKRISSEFGDESIEKILGLYEDFIDKICELDE